jgi:hypothetical protein
MAISHQIHPTNRMKSAQQELRLECLTYQALQSGSHLPAGFDGESATNDIVWLVPMMGKKIGNPGSEGFGFPRSWRCKDLQYWSCGSDGSRLSCI